MALKRLKVRTGEFIRAGLVLVLSLGALAMPPAALAQQAETPRRIGFLGNSTAVLEANLVGPFRDGLRELGYVEGRNLLIEYRWVEGNYDRLPALIGELLASKVEVIVTAGTPATLAVKQATTSTPLVMIAVGDPVGTGIVPSLSRPGGNITGLTSISPELDGKRLELLREVVPGVSHVAVLWNSASPLQVVGERRTHAAAAALHIKLLSLGVRNEDGLEKAFAEILRQRPGALLVLADRLFLYHRERIMKFAAEQRLPGVHAYRELVEAGGLMSFGPSYEGMHRRAAYFVDRILKGEHPGDLPVERPASFELVVNLRAAKGLGLTIPRSLLLRATKVIQ
ncbi:MAG: ABC transporter substrate-binding protein [Betaproteobacteria bacterium]|nr:MAG: ABC transporter substrate-binding protein [Betaproteobacteria bacterium]